MKKIYFLLVLSISVASIFLACKNPPVTGDTSNSNVDIYVAGHEYNGSSYIAKYWKNGQAISITDATSFAYATSMVVVKR